VENGSLSNIIKPTRFGAFPESLVAVYIAQVLEGLAYLHEQGVIHRDIKGANILTTKEGLVKLADFGVATRLDAEVFKEQSVVGTPYWMAPEVIEMAGVSAASDIWSVGCTVVELLTGSPPYFDLNPMTALFRIVQDELPPLPDGISPALDNMLRQCFEKTPRGRPSARALLSHPWLSAMRRDIKQTWPRTRKSRGGAAVHEGVATVVERMLEHESSASSVSAGAASGVLSDPPSPEAAWQVRPPSSLTPSGRRAAGAAAGDGQALGGWASVSAGSLTLTGEPSASRSLLVAEGSASRSTLLLGLSAEPSGARSLLGGEPSQPRSVGGGGGSDGGGGGPHSSGQQHLPGLPVHPSARSTSELWGWLAGTSEREREKGAITAAAADSRAQQQQQQQQQPSQRAQAMGGLFDSPGRSELADAGPTMVRAELEAESVRQIGLLLPDARPGVLTAACERLEGLLADAPSVVAPLLATRAAAPLVELLEARPPPAAAAAALRLAAAACCGRPQLVEQLCALGLLPPTLALAAPGGPASGVRAAAAAALRAACGVGGAPVRMLTACRGLPIVVQLLECPYVRGAQQPPPLCHAGLDVLWRVLELQALGAFACEAFSRQAAQAGLLERLVPLLSALAAHVADARRAAVQRAADATSAAAAAAQAQAQALQRPSSRSAPSRPLRVTIQDVPQPPGAALAAADAAEAAAAGDPDSPYTQLRSASELLLAFSRCADAVVLSRLASEGVLAGMLALLSSSAAQPTLQLSLLKSLRALSRHAQALEAMQRAGAIPALAPFLANSDVGRTSGALSLPGSAAPSVSGPPSPGSARPIRSLSAASSLSSGGGALATTLHVRSNSGIPGASVGEECMSEALQALFNLCRLHATRAEQAATSGVIPHLVRLSGVSPACEAASLGLLCCMAHASRRARAELARHDAARLYLSLLPRPAWQLPALEALAAWLAAEPWRVEASLLEDEGACDALVRLFAQHATAPPSVLLRLIDAFTRITSRSGRVGSKLASAGLVPRALDAASHADATVRLAALKLLRALYEQHPRPKELIVRHDLAAKLGAIAAAERDGDAVLVRAAATQLLEALRVNDAL